MSTADIITNNNNGVLKNGENNMNIIITNNNNNVKEFGIQDIILCNKRGKGHLGNILFHRFMLCQKNALRNIIVDIGRENYITSTRYIKFVNIMITTLQKNKHIWIRRNEENNNEEVWIEIPIDSYNIRELLNIALIYTYDNIEFDKVIQVWLKKYYNNEKEKEEKLNNKKSEETLSLNNVAVVDSKNDDNKNGIVVEDTIEKKTKNSIVDDIENNITTSLSSPPSPNNNNEIDETGITKETEAVMTSPPSPQIITTTNERIVDEEKAITKDDAEIDNNKETNSLDEIQQLPMNNIETSSSASLPSSSSPTEQSIKPTEKGITNESETIDEMQQLTMNNDNIESSASLPSSLPPKPVESETIRPTDISKISMNNERIEDSHSSPKIISGQQPPKKRHNKNPSPSPPKDVDTLASISFVESSNHQPPKKRLKNNHQSNSAPSMEVDNITAAVEAGVHETYKMMSPHHTAKEISSHEENIPSKPSQENVKLNNDKNESTPPKTLQKENESTPTTSSEEDNVNNEENMSTTLPPPEKKKKENEQLKGEDKQHMDESNIEDESVPESPPIESRLSQDLSDKRGNASLKSQQQSDENTEDESFFPSASGAARRSNESDEEKVSETEQHTMDKSEDESDPPPVISKLKSHRRKKNEKKRHTHVADQENMEEDEIEKKENQMCLNQNLAILSPPNDYLKNKHQLDDNNTEDESVSVVVKTKPNQPQVDNNTEDESEIHERKLKPKKRRMKKKEKELSPESDQEQIDDSPTNEVVSAHSKNKSRQHDSNGKVKRPMATEQHQMGDNTEEESVSASHQVKSKTSKRRYKKKEKNHLHSTEKHQADDNTEDISVSQNGHGKSIGSKREDKKINDDHIESDDNDNHLSINDHDGRLRQISRPKYCEQDDDANQADDENDILPYKPKGYVEEEPPPSGAIQPGKKMLNNASNSDSDGQSHDDEDADDDDDDDESHYVEGINGGKVYRPARHKKEKKVKGIKKRSTKRKGNKSSQCGQKQAKKNSSSKHHSKQQSIIEENSAIDAIDHHSNTEQSSSKRKRRRSEAALLHEDDNDIDRKANSAETEARATNKKARKRNRSNKRLTKHNDSHKHSDDLPSDSRQTPGDSEEVNIDPLPDNAEKQNIKYSSSVRETPGGNEMGTLRQDKHDRRSKKKDPSFSPRHEELEHQNRKLSPTDPDRPRRRSHSDAVASRNEDDVRKEEERRMSHDSLLKRRKGHHNATNTHLTSANGSGHGHVVLAVNAREVVRGHGQATRGNLSPHPGQEIRVHEEVDRGRSLNGANGNYGMRRDDAPFHRNSQDEKHPVNNTLSGRSRLTGSIDRDDVVQNKRSISDKQPHSYRRKTNANGFPSESPKELPNQRGSVRERDVSDKVRNINSSPRRVQGQIEQHQNQETESSQKDSVRRNKDHRLCSDDRLSPVNENTDRKSEREFHRPRADSFPDNRGDFNRPAQLHNGHLQGHPVDPHHNLRHGGDNKNNRLYSQQSYSNNVLATGNGHRAGIPGDYSFGGGQMVTGGNFHSEMHSNNFQHTASYQKPRYCVEDNGIWFQYENRYKMILGGHEALVKSRGGFQFIEGDFVCAENPSIYLSEQPRGFFNERYDDQPLQRKTEVVLYKQSETIPLPRHGPLRPDAKSSLSGQPEYDHRHGAELARYSGPRNFVDLPHSHPPAGHLNLSGNLDHQFQGSSSFPARYVEQGRTIYEGDRTPPPSGLGQYDRRENSMHQGLSGRSPGPTTANQSTSRPGRYQTDPARHRGSRPNDITVPDLRKPTPSLQTPRSPILPPGPPYPKTDHVLMSEDVHSVNEAPSGQLAYDDPKKVFESPRNLPRQEFSAVKAPSDSNRLHAREKKHRIQHERSEESSESDSRQSSGDEKKKPAS